MTERIVATDREETEPCQRGTVGCCVDHDRERRTTPRDDEGCECW
jgi:hypothetical protein